MLHLAKSAVKRVFDKLGYRLLRKDRCSGDMFEDLQHVLRGSSVNVILDGGASVGDSAVKLRVLFPQARVYSFEPQKSSFQQLANAARADANIVPIQAALSSQRGHAVLHVASHSPASALSQPTARGVQCYPGLIESTSTQETDTHAIDEWRAQTGTDTIDILKLDIQGHELQALQGAVGLLTSTPPRAICLEVSFVRLYENACLYHEVDEFLRRYGYWLYKYYGLHMPGEGRLTQGEALYLREDEAKV